MAEFLTPSEKFRDVSRGKPKPFTLKGEDQVKARLTPESWRLEIVGDESASVEKPRKIDDGSALDFAGLLKLGEKHSVRYLKAMQCSNIACPLGQGLWEGVPLREVLRTCGKLSNVRRLYWWGFHNDDPVQLFQASMGLNHALETAPGEPPPILAYKLNGRPLSPVRGGPVRVVVPWAHGFKSIKWLRKMVLTNDHKANDTYAGGNNDVESVLKTMAWTDPASAMFKSGEGIVLAGHAMVGVGGLERVEYWLRADTGTHGRIEDDDPAWNTAEWKPCELEPAPTDWGGGLPGGALPKDVIGFDPATGRPREWPMRWNLAYWTVKLPALKAGAYEFRARTVDRNGFAQPEPRPYQKSGQNPITCKTFMVMG